MNQLAKSLRIADLMKRIRADHTLDSSEVIVELNKVYFPPPQRMDRNELQAKLHEATKIVEGLRPGATVDPRAVMETVGIPITRANENAVKKFFTECGLLGRQPRRAETWTRLLNGHAEAAEETTA